MADLSRIRLRALVSETDVGNVRAGQTAAVTVDAFPQRSFAGQVEKIEPQAVVQQSVTMFPVLISISNEDRLLMPGMNGEVTMLVERREDVTAVPVDAVRSMREVATVAPALGLEPDSVRAQIERQIRARSTARAGMDARSDSGSRRAGWAAGTSDSSRRRGGRGPGRGRFRSGADGAASGGSPTGSAGPAAFTGAPGAGALAGSGARANRAQIVFVKTDHGLEPRLVRLGLSDFDYSEVLDGVKEGEQVALVGVAEAQAQRQESQSRIRQRMGSGVPGVPGAGTRGGTGAGGGGRGTGGGRSGGGS
jgi:HlyD family secretion protein